MSSSTKITKYDLDDSVFEGVATESSVQDAIDNAAQYVQAQHTRKTITLSKSSWSNGTQTVACTGVTSDNTVIVSPAPASLDDYGKGKVKCTTQANGSLTFSCDTSKVPESNLTVNIAILGV